MYSVDAKYETIDTNNKTDMYIVNAQYKTIHHNTKVNDDNGNIIPSTKFTERKRNNARDAHNTNRNINVRNVNSKTKVNDDNDTKDNDNNNNNNSYRNNHRMFRYEKHKPYQQHPLIFPQGVKMTWLYSKYSEKSTIKTHFFFINPYLQHRYLGHKS